MKASLKNQIPLSDLKTRADLLWEDIMVALPDVDYRLVGHAMEMCNKIDQAALLEKSKKRELKHGPFTTPNPYWRRDLMELLRQINDQQNDVKE